MVKKAEVKQDPVIKFKDEDEAQIAAQQFLELQNRPAWIRIRKFLEEKLKYYEYQLSNTKFESLDEMYRVRDKKNITEQILNLPEILVEVIKRTGGKEIRFDPYSDRVETDMFKGGKPTFDPYDRPEDIDKQTN